MRDDSTPQLFDLYLSRYIDFCKKNRQMELEANYTQFKEFIEFITDLDVPEEKKSALFDAVCVGLQECVENGYTTSKNVENSSCYELYESLLNLCDEKYGLEIYTKAKSFGIQPNYSYLHCFFIFDNLKNMSDRDIWTVLTHYFHAFSSKKLALCMTTMDEDVRQRIFKNLPKKVAEETKKELYFMPKTPLYKIIDAQQHLISCINFLDRDKLIVAPSIYDKREIVQ